ncbi:MAG TPA: carbohydrate ABC transporter permease [Lachnospiraceae bacterium]
MMKKYISKTVFYLFVLWFVATILLPFAWQFITSIKPLSEIAEMPAKWIPSSFNTDFYVNVFTKHPFVRYLFNSFLVAGMSTVISLAIGSSAAYALGRIKFYGRKVILLIILGVSMFPTIATLSPLYLILKEMGLLNSYGGLILTYVSFSLPMTIWLLTNFLSQLDGGFEEASAIDGCTKFETFIKVIIPLSRPAIFSTGLLVFINCWNEYLYALTFMQEQSMRTVPVGIALFPSNYQLPWGDMAAASIVVTVPLIILVLLFQKHIIAGLTTGGMKG